MADLNVTVGDLVNEAMLPIAADADGTIIIDENIASWVWWSFLVLSATFHLGWYAIEARQHCYSGERKQEDSTLEKTPELPCGRKRTMLILALPYLFQIAWRSVFPSEYPSRTTFFDSSANSVMLERLLAAIGETSFAAQLATAICWVSSDLELTGESMPTFWNCDSRSAAWTLQNIRRFARLLVVMVMVGQCCATAGTATRDRFWFLIEGIIWSGFFVITAVCGWVLGPECRLRARVSTDLLFTRILFLASIPSAVYMICGYCPMCYDSWVQEKDDPDFQPVHFTEGFMEAFSTRVPSRSWSIWRNECVWMSLYFVFGGTAAVSNVSLPPRVLPKQRKA